MTDRAGQRPGALDRAAGGAFHPAMNDTATRGASTIRLRHPLPPLRAGRPAAPDLLVRRDASAMLSGGGAATIELIGGVACAVASGERPRATIVHLHGGGYRMGSAAGWAGFAARFAAATDTNLIVPDYALAPERPFPAALHDAVAVLEAVATTTAGPLILSGDSAGGGLALAVASLLAAPTPLAGLILMSPWADLTLEAGSYDRCAASDRLFSRTSADASRADYLQGTDPRDPLASPLGAPCDGLPPTLIVAAAGEVLVDDSLALLRRLTAAGLRATLHVEPGVQHVWPVLAPGHPATARTFALARLLVDEAVSSPDAGGSIAASG